MRRHAPLGALLVALGSAGVAPTPARAEAPLLDRLPVLPPAPPAPRPEEQPAQIPAGEKVAGFFVVLQPEAMRRENEYAGYHAVLMTTNAARANTFATTGRQPPGDTSAGRPTSCMEGKGDTWQTNQATSPRPRPASDPAAKRSNPKATVAPVPPPAKKKGAPRGTKAHPNVNGNAKKAPPPKPTHLMAFETFVAGADGRATLDRTELWVDYATLGARLVRKTSVPYVRFSTGPHGLELYGAKGEGGTVDVIVRTPERPSELGSFQTQDQGGASSTSEDGCGILKGTLSLDDAGGATAIVMGQMALDGRASDDTEPDPDAGDGEAPGEVVHMRPLQAVISLSKTASEPTPFLSVSYAWAGRDERLEMTPSPRRCAHCREPGPRPIE